MTLGPRTSSNPGVPSGERLARVRIDDAHADARQRMADVSALRAHLAKTRRAKVARVHGDHGRAFRGAVAFERPDAEAVFECLRQTFRQFFRADHHELQAAEILGRAAPRIRLQKRRRGQQERDAVIADEFADGGQIERARMVDDADAEHGRQPQRHREAERVEEGQNAQQAIAADRT